MGVAVDAATGAWWKPDITEKGVSKIDYDHYLYTIEYKAIPAKEQEVDPKVNVSEKAYSTIFSNNEKYSNMDLLEEDEAKSITYLLSVEDLKSKKQIVYPQEVLKYL